MLQPTPEALPRSRCIQCINEKAKGGATCSCGAQAPKKPGELVFDSSFECGNLAERFQIRRSEARGFRAFAANAQPAHVAGQTPADAQARLRALRVAKRGKRRRGQREVSGVFVFRRAGSTQSEWGRDLSKFSNRAIRVRTSGKFGVRLVEGFQKSKSKSKMLPRRTLGQASSGTFRSGQAAYRPPQSVTW